MEINGKEVGFRYSVGVNIWLQELTIRDPDIPPTKMYMLLAVEMSKAYARANGTEALTEDELLEMDLQDFQAIMSEVDIMIKMDKKTTVEIAEPKGKKKENAKKQS